MGQSQSKDRRASASSTTPLNPPDSHLLEENYAAFYGSDTFNDIPSAAVCDTISPPSDAAPVQELDQSESISTITQPGPRPNIFRVSELIDPHDLMGRYQQDLSGNRLNHIGKSPERKTSATGLPDINKRLPGLVQSPSGNILGATEFLAHPNRPLAIRERQENIKKALEKAQMEERARSEDPEKMARPDGGSKDRKSSTDRKGSGSTFGDQGYGTSSASLGNFESRKIEEGKRIYEEKLRKKEESGAGCFSCFRGGG